MRRGAFVVVVGILLVLGFGAAYVLAGPSSSKQSVHITICHSGNGKEFTQISPDNVGVLVGHAKEHSDDIIPPFVVVNEKGTEVSSPGENMDSIYGGGYTGAEVLANGCDIPGGPVITQTESIETATTTEPVTVTTPDTTVTLPGGTTTAEVPVTITVPGDTTTAPGTTTVITVPSDVTTTVTLPPRTTTLPPVTRTVAGQTIERPAETVTLPGTTATVTAAATTTVVTVTGPNQVVHARLVTRKRVRTTIRTPKRVVHIAGRVVRVRRGVLGTRVVVVVSRPRNCPPGTAPSHGQCSPIVHGKG